MPTLNEIQLALSAVESPVHVYAPNPTHAAVAMILTDGAEGLEVCFIRRAERAGDPWSGQVAFPGGRASAEDADPFAVAERETWEEIGLRLMPSQRVGALPMRPVHSNDRRAGLTLWPFVYYVDTSAYAIAKPRLPQEVANVFWVPIGHLFDREAVTEIVYPPDTGSRFPGILFDTHVIWGLTLRVLASFAEVLQRELPAFK